VKPLHIWPADWQAVMRLTLAVSLCLREYRPSRMADSRNLCFEVGQ
jgi:hypothetical protein